MKDASFREEQFCHWELSLYLSSSLELYWFSWESLWSDFLTMIHGPSSLFIWRLFDVSWFSSIDQGCVFSRGTFLCLKIFALSFLIPRVILILVRKPLGLFWIMIHGPSSLFIWRLVDVSWFSSIDERCVFSRGTLFVIENLRSIFPSSLELCWFSWESLWSDFLIMIHGPSSLFIWRLVDVS